jgi:signal transduction histidine kinase
VETAAGDLWLHGTAGVILIKAGEVRRALGDPAHAMAYRLYAYEDGMIGVPADLRPLPTLVAGVDGRLWFATSRGVYMHDPRRPSVNGNPPSIVAKAIVAGGTRHLPVGSIDLPALTTSLQFDYTVTDMAVPERTRFRHKLSGVDDDWQEGGARRQAFYTNVGPGAYRLQVTAANEDGVWNTTGTTVDFVIAPAWYQTTWFHALCVLAALAALGLLFHLRIRQMRAQIQGRLQERLLERERIARELHDTLIQGFQGLILTFAATIERIAPGEPRELLGRAVERAQDTLAVGRDRVRDLRDSVGFEGDLPTALKDVATDLAIAHPAAFELSERGIRRDLHPVGAEEVFLIAREALANAFRHAAAKRIDAEIEYDASHVRVRIRDDGKGIPAEVIEHGIPGHWGMTGMRERAQKLGARLLVRSGARSGTEVELEVPAEVVYVR